jgi:CubicO group peptidase (beta-lactamase class C family)
VQKSFATPVSVVLSAVAITACGLPAPPASATSREGALDAMVAHVVSEERIPGLSLTVVEDGRVVYAKGFGTTSVTRRIEPTADTQYRLASVSKPFTAVGIFQLVQDGQVALDAPVRDYCPELSPLPGAPTVRHLLMHRSGLRHSTDAEDTRIKGPFPHLGAALANIVREPLLFPRGTKTLYTSWGYAALGCVIEGASGTAYTSPTFSSGFRRGRLYGVRPSLVVDTRFKTPASGIISTVNDMARFAIAIFDRTLVSDATATEMFGVQRDPEGRAVFTAGWTTDSMDPGGTARHSYGQAFDFNGSMEGSTAYIDLVPSRRYAVALLANRERSVAEVQPIIAEARRLILEDSFSPSH